MPVDKPASAAINVGISFNGSFVYVLESSVGAGYDEYGRSFL